MLEPGIDEHGWISRWESLEPDLHESPAEALVDVDDLVAEERTRSTHIARSTTTC